jgi:CHAT domain-containing protein
MAMTVSRAFLAAGARRVLASQWSVEDRAGCEFIATLLANVAAQWRSAAPCQYAAAMAAARNALRHRSDQPWSDPYYWSSFVLIGPATDAPPSTGPARPNLSGL